MDIIDRSVINKWNEWISSSPLTHAVTLAFNRPYELDHAQAVLKEWGCRMNRALLGPRWMVKPSRQQLIYFATLEHPTSNAHLHLSVVTPDDLKGRFPTLVDPIWKKLVKAGSTNCQEITDPEKWVKYANKDLWQHHPDYLTISTEFRND